jgi:putative ABC transport system substrate-binding protein
MRCPAVSPIESFTGDGGLLAYSGRSSDQFRQAAVYVDKILRGSHPGDLPVQLPTQFDLKINLKTAKVLGLTIPPAMLARADEVIE